MRRRWAMVRPRKKLDRRTSERWKGYIVHYADRERILAEVGLHPGCNATYLREKLGLPWAVLSYHLSHLVRQEKVRVARPDRKTKRYVLADAKGVTRGQISALFWRPHLTRLLQLLSTRDAWRRFEVLRETDKWGWKRSTADYRVRQLVRSSFVVIERRMVSAMHRTFRYYTVVREKPLSNGELLFWTRDPDEERAYAAKQERRFEAARDFERRVRRGQATFGAPVRGRRRPD